MRGQAASVQTAALATDPAPTDLPQLVADPARVWERRPGQPDYLRVRIGVGNVSWFDLTPPVEQNPVQPLDPLMLQESRLVAEMCAVADGMPLWLDLSRGGDIAFIGSRTDTTNMARAVIAQIACLHSPDDVRIAAVVSPDNASLWLGFNLLPHAFASASTSGVPRALMAATLDNLSVILETDLTARIRRISAQRHSGTPGAPVENLGHMIVFLDEHGHTAEALPIPEEGYTPADLGITLVHMIDDRLDEPSVLDTRVTIRDDGRVALEELSAPSGAVTPEAGWADTVSAALFEAVASDLAPLTTTAVEADDRTGTTETISALRLLGIDSIDQLEPDTIWKPRSSRDFLRIPIGLDDHGAPLLLDLKEPAQRGMGPHGICIGATGSGKSELLRTLVLALAVAHPPDDLAMILVDFKGGAAFAPFARLPHLAGLIDNLADDPQLTRRARESIAGEVQRRQEVLKQADSASSISHYRQMRVEDPSLPPMPHLFIVIDEFGELLSAEPEFADLLLKIGRIGRSIGVHLLLASQRIEAGMLHGLETYLSYWIGMRTFSESESRAILDTPDAYTLPDLPGYGYLKVSTSVYTKFRAGYVSGPMTGPADEVKQDDEASQANVFQTVSLFDITEQAVTGVVEEQLAPPDVGNLLVDEAVSRLESATPTQPVWLPPLRPRLTLGAILSQIPETSIPAPMVFPIGLLDDPSHQQQGAWQLDLTAHGGHAAIIGAPQTGRSTFLRTIAVSLALTFTPRQVSIYGIDLSGGGLSRIKDLPHVGGVATRSDRPLLVRLFEELRAMINQREMLFREHRIDSPAALRAAHARGEVPELVAPDVVILVDGVDPIRNEFSDLDDPFTELVQRGGAFGIHLVVALTRWNELRTNLQPLIGQKFELRLNDPSDSILQRAAQQALRHSSPGRALTQELLYGQIALPILDDVEDDATIGDEIAELGQRYAHSWAGPSAAPIRLLPESLSPSDLPDEFDEPDRAPIGVSQDGFHAAFFDPVEDQHLLVFGDAKCGKTTLLRGIAGQFIKRFTPDDLVFAIIDPRGTLASEIPNEYLGGKAATATDALILSQSIAAEIAKRHPGSGDWPRVLVLVDDYDIIAAGGTQPLQPLIAYLPSARDLKLSVVLARPVTGAGRAQFDPAIQAIRDTGGSGLLMNGERSEGALFPKVYPEQFVPGRGKYVQRGSKPKVIQIANFTKEVTDAA